eukprot:SAG22_NODE_21_length_31784_cov_15.522897_8_plen_162_part_00
MSARYALPARPPLYLARPTLPKFRPWFRAGIDGGDLCPLGCGIPHDENDQCELCWRFTCGGDCMHGHLCCECDPDTADDDDDDAAAEAVMIRTMMPMMMNRRRRRRRKRRKRRRRRRRTPPTNLLTSILQTERKRNRRETPSSSPQTGWRIVLTRAERFMV